MPIPRLMPISTVSQVSIRCVTCSSTYRAETAGDTSRKARRASSSPRPTPSRAARRAVPKASLSINRNRRRRGTPRARKIPSSRRRCTTAMVVLL